MLAAFTGEQTVIGVHHKFHLFVGLTLTFSVSLILASPYMTWRVWEHFSNMNWRFFIQIRIWHPAPFILQSEKLLRLCSVVGLQTCRWQSLLKSLKMQKLELPFRLPGESIILLYPMASQIDLPMLSTRLRRSSTIRMILSTSSGL